MQKFTKKIFSVLLILIITFSGYAGTLDSSMQTVITNLKAAVDYDTPDLFDLLFEEAKTYYVEALIADHFKDTSEVKFCIDRSLEIIAQISEIDSLTMLQKDDYNRFYEKFSEDLQESMNYLNGDSGTYKSASIREKISEAVSETVTLYNDTLEILEDRHGHFPIVTSKKIKRIIEYFQTKEKKRFQGWIDNSGLYKDLMIPILTSEGLPEEIFYLALIESGYNTKAYSYAHAAGPWQFIAATGARYGLTRNWWMDERRDPIKSTKAAAKYLSDLHDMFGDWFLALAAYNCGEGRVRRAIRLEGTKDYWKLRSLPKQTRNYIPTMMAGMIIAMNPEDYGFKNNPKDTWSWDEVTIDKSYELSTIGKAINLSTEKLVEYNPELRRFITPPDAKQYVLRVPPGKGKLLEQKLKELPVQDSHPEFITHKVYRGQTLSYIARKYGTSVSAIAAANNLRSRNRISIGQVLRIPQTRNYSSNYTKPSGKYKYHYVKKGETLSEIAEKYNMGLSVIRSWNNLYGRRFLQIGQKLKVSSTPAPKVTAKNTPDGKRKIIHTVRRGETLIEIADRYDVWVKNLRSWNNIRGSMIRVGQKIIIYKKI